MHLKQTQRLISDSVKCPLPLWRSKHRAAAIVALHTIFKVSAELRNDFRRNKFTVHNVGYAEIRYMRDATALFKKQIKLFPRQGLLTHSPWDSFIVHRNVFGFGSLYLYTSKQPDVKLPCEECWHWDRGVSVFAAQGMCPERCWQYYSCSNPATLSLLLWLDLCHPVSETTQPIFK